VTEPVDEIMARITASNLASLIDDLSATQSGDNKAGVSLPDIVQSLTAGYDLGVGAAHWRVQLQIKAAIKRTVALIPGMRYIEGDA